MSPLQEIRPATQGELALFRSKVKPGGKTRADELIKKAREMLAESGGVTLVFSGDERSETVHGMILPPIEQATRCANLMRNRLGVGATLVEEGDMVKVVAAPKD
ncbi:hypothetical protein A3H89_04260 [Candidatus Amesbacteria bacterium RIFCSPLOWO2_02_FULL_48_11]|uniref:Uncharacterized protein n=4 Tax=Candidatus Amesiibacteriota TaxID=1752730 RepID=A0A1F4Z7X0_9BACT|nr:MAG: hypothetical protein UX78_C0015G0011 [Candidatus Amesbacteria bacterium GW2011_GWA2_47_11]KKU99721.1 MAG: hypothetical protein UY33_C0024G0026 [Candidatus Amesbacteria bacterium GW2011_GWA1_48_9]OGC91368.1 MAG: hypothetical protein A2V48_00045 [Candidatus Amesbacteria bacterium RBG_19FT_COMBO_48_16]OGC98970.1 MAG: hypothetical protein A2702_00325 [Candidatus Amesbacteria bacterium RIFCSPHIGHO2_01_FULL_48_75]OGD02057.1 MAG: hypothetical protein A3E17_04605 [Candidatus Amesbacteria bacter